MPNVTVSTDYSEPISAEVCPAGRVHLCPSDALWPYAQEA